MTDDEIKAIRTIYDRGYTTKTWARFAYDFREKAEKLEEENARLREALVRMLMWQPRSTEAACEQDYEFARSVVASAWRKP